MSIGGRDMLKEKKEVRAEEYREKKEKQKRKYEEQKKQEEEDQRTAWSRLEDLVGADSGVDNSAVPADPNFSPPRS